MRAGAAITGFGLVAAVGNEPVALGPVPPLSGPEPGRAAAIEDFDIDAYVRRKGTRHLSRTSQLACAAASRLAPALDALPTDQVGVVLGSKWAALDTIVRFEREAWTEGARFVDPLLFTETVPNVPAGQVSIVFGWSALNMTLGGAVAGLEAIARGIDLLEEGRARVVVAGGADALHTHLTRVLDARRDADARPCGEAACLISLESPDAARERGAAVAGRVLARAGRALARAEDDRAARDALLEGLMAEAGLGREVIELAVVAEPAGPEAPAPWGERAPWVSPPPRLGRTWAAAGPLALVSALDELSRRAAARHGAARGVVLGRGERELWALLLEVEAP